MPDAREFGISPLEGLRHEPEAIQPHGWLIVCDARAVKILRHSNNLAKLFSGRPGPFVGAKLTELIGSEAAHALRNSLARFAGPARPALLPHSVFPGCDGAFDLAASQTGEETLVEIERAEPSADRLALDRTRAMVDRIAQASDLGRSMQTAARLVYSVLQYDRVEILRFPADEAAELLAQQHSHDLEPAATAPDLPDRTRALLHVERMRVIVDAAAPPAPILSGPGAATLDLGCAHLRAASQDEGDALRRDGFVASMSIALVVDGDLWGAILCRDRAPRRPSMDMRASIEIFADFLALRVQVLQQKQALKAR